MTFLPPPPLFVILQQWTICPHTRQVTHPGECGHAPASARHRVTQRKAAGTSRSHTFPRGMAQRNGETRGADRVREQQKGGRKEAAPAGDLGLLYSCFRSKQRDPRTAVPRRVELLDWELRTRESEPSRNGDDFGFLAGRPVPTRERRVEAGAPGRAARPPAGCRSLNVGRRRESACAAGPGPGRAGHCLQGHAGREVGRQARSVRGCVV